MSIRFHYASGSPYAWRVWLALEHKALAYDLQLMSFSAGDLARPEFLALNPRHKVPVLVEDGFALYESAAIVEYLDEAHPERPLLPAGLRDRAIARRQICEADHYLGRVLDSLGGQIFFRAQSEWDAQQIARDRATLAQELARFEQMLAGAWFAGGPGAVDYTVYPMIALAMRLELRAPELDLGKAVGPRTADWMRRFEALPAFAVTYPPHWKN